MGDDPLKEGDPLQIPHAKWGLKKLHCSDGTGAVLVTLKRRGTCNNDLSGMEARPSHRYPQEEGQY